MRVRCFGRGRRLLPLARAECTKRHRIIVNGNRDSVTFLLSHRVRDTEEVIERTALGRVGPERNGEREVPLAVAEKEAICDERVERGGDLFARGAACRAARVHQSA